MGASPKDLSLTGGVRQRSLANPTSLLSPGSSINPTTRGHSMARRLGDRLTFCPKPPSTVPLPAGGNCTLSHPEGPRLAGQALWLHERKLFPATSQASLVSSAFLGVFGYLGQRVAKGTESRHVHTACLKAHTHATLSTTKRVARAVTSLFRCQ